MPDQCEPFFERISIGHQQQLSIYFLHLYPLATFSSRTYSHSFAIAESHTAWSQMQLTHGICFL